jgi:hypothetical protein
LKATPSHTDKIRAAVVIIDRVGIGPHSSQDISIGTSLVEQWAVALDALEANRPQS